MLLWDGRRSVLRVDGYPRRIKANPKKIQEFENTQSPRSKKDVHNFVWTEDAEKAFQDMKAFLKELPTLTVPIQGETLTVYLAASSEAISSVLIADRGKTQTPVYFVSKVLTNQPIRHVLARLEISWRIAKWAIELGEHKIIFLPRNSVKGQVIVDFLVELPSDIISQGETPVTRKDEDEFWELYTDGASNEEGACIGLLLVSPNGEEITYAIRLKFAASNSETEYEALLAGLRLKKTLMYNGSRPTSTRSWWQVS
ncbi:uncharacterized protein [Rutidosis leptorrhynchoides]|uniref:uncharacterized protein n=1 Tax=Rutidosis leptorrhynchoides TaxID=125765 RepID=UPI003A991225